MSSDFLVSVGKSIKIMEHLKKNCCHNLTKLQDQLGFHSKLSKSTSRKELKDLT